MHNKKIILIDLDGVLNEYNGNFDYNVIPPIKKGAKEFVKKLVQNYELKLFTTRNLLLAVKWLQKYQLDKYFTDVTNVKVPAYLIIDDRCIKFDGCYEKIIDEITDFNTYWKNNPL